METLLQDVRYCLRMFSKNLGFLTVAIVALTVGIGANTAIFSVLNAVLLRPLPFKEPDKLLTMWETNPQIQIGFDKFPCTAGNFVDWQNQNKSFDDMAALRFAPFNLEGRGNPERIGGARVTEGLFRVLGVNAAIGRTFRPEEDQPGHDKVVVIGYGLWQRRFGSDPGIVGQSLTLNGQSYDVIGVMPKDFQYPRGADLPPYLRFAKQTEIWSPIALSEAAIKNRGGLNYAVLGRLKSGVTLKQAQTEMSTIAARLAEQYPQTDAGFGVLLVPMKEQIVGSLRQALVILVGAVCFVLLIACTNVANLLLARASTRQKEISIRTALGASRMRILRQLLTESILLAFLGGLLGLLLAKVGVDLLVAFTPENIPRVRDVSLDWRVLVFTLAVSFFTGIVFGLVPALQASKPDLNESLKEGGRGSSGGKHTARNLLVVCEVALALVLLIGAGLMIKSFLYLQRIDPGINPNNVLAMQLSVPAFRYQQNEQRQAFFEQVMRNVQSVAGVKSVGGTSEIPLSGEEDLEGFLVEGQPPATSLEETPLTNYHVITPDYFRALGMTLIKGREFTDHDIANSPGVVTVNETFGRRFLPGEEVLGKRISFGDQSGPWLTIVGVVRDVKHTALDSESRPESFVPYLQNTGSDLSLIVRTTPNPVSLISDLRNAIWAVDKEIPTYNLKTMEQIVSESSSQRRLNTVLLVAFAAAALLLASVGIYGVMSYSVTQRTREIGIRMAMGSQQKDVFKLIVGHALKLALIGLGIGLIVAFALTRLMSSLLYEVSSTDPTTFAIISILLAGVVLAASFVPAWRAMSVDPILALRHD